MLTAPLAVVTAFLYGMATWQIAGTLFDRAPDRGRQPLLLAATAALVHALLIISLATGSGQLSFHFINAMSTTSWLISTLVLLLALREPLQSLGMVVFPISAVFALISATGDANNAAPLSPGVALHAAVSVVAYGILMVSAVQACALAIQNNRLHAHAAGGFVRKLPPLASMERLLFRLIGTGFTALSLALISGFLFLDNIFAQHLAHKTILSILAWAVFGALLIGRRLAGWRGRTAVRWTLVGSFLLVLAYAGSKFVTDVLLER